VKAEVGRFKGSPDTIRKRLPSEGEPKVTPPPIIDGSYDRSILIFNEREIRDPNGTEILIELGAPLLAAAGQVVAKLFSKH